MWLLRKFLSLLGPSMLSIELAQCLKGMWVCRLGDNLGGTRDASQLAGKSIIPCFGAFQQKPKSPWFVL